MEKNSEALSLKQEGNSRFLNSRFDQAIEAYTKAANLQNIDASLRSEILCNLSLAQTKLDNFSSALDSAQEALDANPQHLKGLYRKAQALYGLGLFKKALNVLEELQQRGVDGEYVRGFKIRASSALSMGAIKSAFSHDDENYIEDSLPDDPNYFGPKLGRDEKVSLRWVKNLFQFLRSGGVPSKKLVWAILRRSKKILSSEPNLQRITLDDRNQVTVIGDVHGQLFDVLNIFHLNGLPTEKAPYLFNGDFVDRGIYGVEVMCVLLSLKLMNPQCIYLNRGNHESAKVTSMYGFEGEVMFKYCRRTYELFCDLFNQIPLCAVVDNRVFVTHGGLFERGNVKLEDLEKLGRFQDIPEEGLMCDLMWADPIHLQGRHPTKRSLSVQFGPDIVDEFLQLNGLELVIRSHEVAYEGVEEIFDGKLFTLFSAPNYCDEVGNEGAFCVITQKSKPRFVRFDAVPHPPANPKLVYAMENSYLLR